MTAGKVAQGAYTSLNNLLSALGLVNSLEEGLWQERMNKLTSNVRRVERKF